MQGGAARDALKAWLSVGGLAAAASLASSDPAITAVVVSSLATFVAMPSTPWSGEEEDDDESNPIARRLAAAISSVAEDTKLVGESIIEAAGDLTKSGVAMLPASGEELQEALTTAEQAMILAEREAAQAELLAAAQAARVKVACNASDAAQAAADAAAADSLELDNAVIAARDLVAEATAAAEAAANATPATSEWKRERQAKRHAELGEAADEARALLITRQKEADEAKVIGESLSREAAAYEEKVWDVCMKAATEERLADEAKAKAAEARGVVEAAVEEATKRQQTEEDARKVQNSVLDAGGAIGSGLFAAAAALASAAEELLQKRRRELSRRRRSGRSVRRGIRRSWSRRRRRGKRGLRR